MLPAGVQYEQSLDGIDLKIVDNGRSRQLEDAYLKIIVPNDLFIDVSTYDGDITLENIEGQIKAVSVAGNIQAEQLMGDVLLKSGRGEVRVKECSGEIRVLGLQRAVSTRRGSPASHRRNLMTVRTW